jgi:hypothetical protein
MLTTDKLIPTGAVTLRGFDADGLLWTWNAYNLVVNGGRQAISRLLGNQPTGKNIDRFAVGSNGSGAVLTDVAITDQFAKAVSGISFPGNGVQFAFSLELSEANGLTIREFALLCADNTVFSRIVRAPIIKDNTVRIEGTWTINF